MFPGLGVDFIDVSFGVEHLVVFHFQCFKWFIKRLLCLRPRVAPVNDIQNFFLGSGAPIQVFKFGNQVHCQQGYLPSLQQFYFDVPCCSYYFFLRVYSLNLIHIFQISLVYSLIYFVMSQIIFMLYCLILP